MIREQIEQQMRRDVPGYTDSVYAELVEIHIEVERQRNEAARAAAAAASRSRSTLR